MGQRKILSPRRKLNPWPLSYWLGALINWATRASRSWWAGPFTRLICVTCLHAAKISNVEIIKSGLRNKKELIGFGEGGYQSFHFVKDYNNCFIFRTLLKLGVLLWSSNIPLLVCRSYGFIGCMRIVLQEHCGKDHLQHTNLAML